MCAVLGATVPGMYLSVTVRTQCHHQDMTPLLQLALFVGQNSGKLWFFLFLFSSFGGSP